MQLSDVISITQGYPFRGSIPEIPDSDIRAVQMKDISEKSYINWEACVRTQIPGKSIPDFLKPGQILFVPRGNNNYAVLVDENALKFKAVAAPHFYILQCPVQNLIPEYLVWFLNQEPAQRYFKREAEGTTTMSIRRSVLEKTPITVPGITKQKAIIKLHTSLRDEQKHARDLIRNGEVMMSIIANDLVKNAGVTRGETRVLF